MSVHLETAKLGKIHKKSLSSTYKRLRNVFKQLAATNMDLSHCFLDVNCPHRHWARKTTRLSTCSFPPASPAGPNAHSTLSVKYGQNTPGQAATDGGPAATRSEVKCGLHRREDTAWPPHLELSSALSLCLGCTCQICLDSGPCALMRHGICQSPIGNCWQPN